MNIEDILTNFDISDFDSPDLPGTGCEMKPSTLKLVQCARDIAGIPFIVNSGYRTEYQNKKVGGKTDSSHLRGYAVDLKCSDSRTRKIMVDSLLKAGFNRIGIGNTFIHADNDSDKYVNMIWLYS